jgi:Helicase associated domain
MSNNNMSGKAEMYFWSSNRSTTSSNDAAGLRPTERAYPTLKSSSASQPSTATALPAPSLAVEKTSNTMMDSTLSLAENSNNDSNRRTSVDKRQKQPHPQPHQQHKPPPPPPQQQQQPRVFASTLENHNPVSKLQHSGKKSKHNIKRPATAYNKSSGGEEDEAGEATSLAVVAGNAATSSSTTATMTQAEQRPFKRNKPNRACPSSVGAVASTDSSNNGNHHHQHHVVDVQDDTHWDEYYYQLCLFKVVEGHLLVPHDYVCTDDYFGGQNGMEFRVGEWVQRQRFELSPSVQAENEQRTRSARAHEAAHSKAARHWL